MDAVNFAKDYIRMCRTINYCTQCPLNDTGFCRSALEPLSQKNAEEIVRRVEEWAAAHPVKTRQSVFQEQYPEAFVAADGILYVCPKNVSAEYRDVAGNCVDDRRPCDECRHQFWLQEVED